ncbi:MAG: hypothetical protein EU547_04000 [Promethearchaeota archaeon]|nr:MAG: hypothetical protein EU547_04000 [Candidatus Lokiarchaeota archaeon]
MTLLFGGGKDKKKDKKKEKEAARREYPQDTTGEITYSDEREGLAALINLIETVNVEQDHYGEVENINFEGKLEVRNPSTENRIWDIDIQFGNVESTDLESEEFEIKELGTSDDNNSYSHEFKLEEKAKNLLMIKEYINTLSDAEDILSDSAIEEDLMVLREQRIEEDEDTERPNLESFGIAINQLNTVTFAIAVYNLYEKPIKNLEIIKEIPNEFENINIADYSHGSVDKEGDEINWTVDELEPESLAVLKVTADLTIEEKEAVQTGTVKINYKAESSFTGGLTIDEFEAYTNNKHFIDLIEREKEPNMWDCELIFENPSQFDIELYGVDVHDKDSPNTSFITIDSDNPPFLPPGAQWKSPMWEYESEDYPSFQREINFRVAHEFLADVSGEISLAEEQLVLASIMGELEYELPEEIVEEFGEDTIPSYHDVDIMAIQTLKNDGSAPLNEIKFTQKGFSDYSGFNLPDPDDPEDFERIELLVDGESIELDRDNIYVDDDSIVVSLEDLRDTTGMIEPDSEVELKYPIHAIQPKEELDVETQVIYNANTYPVGEELEYIPEEEEIPVITVVHIRRKYRLGKEIVPISGEGKYQIILFLENLGTKKENTLKNFTIIDKVPDSFEYGEFSMEPEIIDEYGEDTLKWEIEELDPEDEIEITYEITGEGEYEPSKAQVSY